MLIFLWVPILHLCSPLGRHMLPAKQVPICLCICLRQRSRRSEPREAQKSFTSLTQSRYSVVQMGRERPRRVTWKQASWLGGGATKSQGEVRIRSPPGFPFCLQDRPLCWAICLGMFSLVFIPAQSNQDLSALPWGAPVPHIPQPLPSTVSSLSLAFSQGHLPIRKIISDPSHTVEFQL